MATVERKRLTLDGLEENLKEKQNLLEKQKLEHDEKVNKKEHLMAKVN